MIASIAWKNITYKPLNAIMSLILLTSAVAIISLIILLERQFEEKFASNIEGVDLVLGAQGSPLQLILSSVYQIDAPTGNISYDSAKVWMKHPFATKAIPLSFGDNYAGFKIVGTTPQYLEHFKVPINTGKLFAKNFEVVVGSEVARKLKLKPGSKFFGSHGQAEGGEVHEDFPYVVTGIAAPTGKVADNLILCNLETVWAMHSEHDHEEENPPHGEEGHVHIEGDDHDHSDHDHSHNDHDDHDHDAHHEADEKTEVANSAKEQDDHFENQEITAVIFKIRNKMAFVLWPRLVSQNTKMQMVSPAVEVNRLFTLFGFGLQALQYLAYGIMLISGLSIFIALYNTLKERKYEFALMRISGAGKMHLFGLVLFESILLCVLGFFFGMLLGRLALALISASTEEAYKMTFDPLVFAWDKEGLLFLLTIFVGVVAAMIPAIKAYRLNISKTLANA